MTINPLLDNLDLPNFGDIRPEHVGSALDSILIKLNAKFSQIEQKSEPTWENLMIPLEEIERELSAVWGPVTHLLNVDNSEQLRFAHEQNQKKVMEFSLKLSQSESLYQKLEGMRSGQNWTTMNSLQQRIIEKNLLEAKLAGVALNCDKKNEFRQLAQQLSELSTTFSNNLLDSINAYHLLLEDPKDMAGMPESYLEMSHLAAQEKMQNKSLGCSKTGPWLITLDIPSYQPFQQYCENRDLRQQVYQAYVTRASQGEHDNSAIISEILKLRKKLASLLGFENFAQMSLCQKMAGTISEVDKLLGELKEKSFPPSLREFSELQTFAREQGFSGDLKQWDTAYYGEKFREKLFNFSEEELRQYFPIDTVLNGLFELVETLFGVTVQDATPQVRTWDKNVRFFRVYENKKEIAQFFLDPFSRPANKRGGAWMDVCKQRGIHQGQLHLPVAYLICNATPPIDNRPSLLTFREVETLFHEFGHGLQHMLTKIDLSTVAGIAGVEWDAVELPSQFMENWCYHKKTIEKISGHFATGEKLPDSLFDKILKARNHGSATAMCRQLHFAILDIELHARFDTEKPVEAIFQTNAKIAASITAIPPMKEDRFLCSFAHIFAGGYAAGYYSYKWAEVLSADAFGAFAEGCIEDPKHLQEIGRRFRDTILSLGGSVHPLEVFQQFRGRPPQVEALLKQTGLL